MEVKHNMEKDLEIIFNRVNEVYWELIELLRQKHPEYIPLYQARFEYTDPKYPLAMRLHNAYEILRTWHQLKFQR
jgi:hypothetical protein